MPINVLVHIANEEPILGDIEEMPVLTDTLLILRNARKRDGKDVHFLAENVTTVVWPWERIAFLEILPSEEDEEIIGFVRE
ncbi:MAG: hypothetical protein HYZ26_13705 [Chloroflexi bacterium]|nr:hypothetical protein [Chloroflexota bacterium]